MRCAPMLGRNFECGACLHLFIQNCFARAMRFQCGHSMCSTAQQLVGQDMQGQALKWQLRLGTIFSVNGQQMCWFLSLLSLKFEKKKKKLDFPGNHQHNDVVPWHCIHCILPFLSGMGNRLAIDYQVLDFGTACT